MKVWVASEIDLASPGGPLEHLNGLWNVLGKRGLDVTLSVPPPTGALARRFDLTLDPLGSRWLPRQIAFQLALRRCWSSRLRHGSRPDCIYIRGGQWLLTPARFAKRHGVPLFIEVNGIVVKQLVARGFPSLALRVVKDIERQVCRNAYRVLAICPSVRDWLIQAHGLQPERVVLMPTGVDCTEFRPPADANERMAERRKFGFGEELCLGYVGTFDWWQGLPNFIAALAHLQQRKLGGDWKAVLAGYGVGEAGLREQVAACGLEDRVRFLGKIPSADVPAFLRAIDVGLLPRDDYAPTPTKLLQYFATGLPSVYPALPDLLWLGTAGLTYTAGRPPQAEDGLAGALAKVCENASYRTELGRRSRELCLAQLDWEAIASKVEALMQQAVKEREAPA